MSSGNFSSILLTDFVKDQINLPTLVYFIDLKKILYSIYFEKVISTRNYKSEVNSYK